MRRHVILSALAVLALMFRGPETPDVFMLLWVGTFVANIWIAARVAADRMWEAEGRAWIEAWGKP